MTYRNDVSIRNKNAVQTERADPRQVMNHAGGYTFQITPKQLLHRFLILGTVGGTYYASQRQATKEAVDPILELIKQDGVFVVQETAVISNAGRAPKNDPAILVLALCLSHGDDATKAAAVMAVPQICRTGTHILTLADYLSSQRGWGRVARKAIHRWFQSFDSEGLAYQAVKYKQRNGWSLRDLLRLSHYTAKSERRRSVLHYIAKGELADTTRIFSGLNGLSAETVVDRIKSYLLPWESLPTELLARADVWDALSDQMPVTALIRNLGRLSSLGVITPMSKKARDIASFIPHKERLRKARVHPLFLLTAWAQYRQGHGMKGSLSWTVSSEVEEALEEAYYLSFDLVQPTGKRHYLGLDVSGSMSARIAGTGISSAQAAACLASVTHKQEPYTYIAGFCNTMVPIKMQKKAPLGGGIQVAAFGRTDCSLPMQDAIQKKIEADVFVVYTDNETYGGSVHPHIALERYRQKTGIPAKLVVVGMTATNFSIANPSDPGMLDVVGFDTTLPQVLAEFSVA